MNLSSSLIHNDALQKYYDYYATLNKWTLIVIWKVVSEDAEWHDQVSCSTYIRHATAKASSENLLWILVTIIYCRTDDRNPDGPVASVEWQIKFPI